MKKTRFSKILVFVLSIALLIGSALVISAGAADSETDVYEIKAMNIVYADRTYVLLAVDAPIEDVEAGRVTVSYSYGAVRGEAKYWKEMTENEEKNPTGLPVFFTEGISPKDIGEEITVWAYVTGAEDFTPDTKSVSVAKYLYSMLYRSGAIEATSGTELSKKELYEALLVYGAKAATALWNDLPENADKQRVLVTDRIYVTAEAATIGESGMSDALLYEAGTVTLKKTAAYTDAYEGWLVTTYNSDGTKTVTTVKGDTVSVSGHTVIVPATAEIEYDPDFEPIEGGVSLNFEDESVYPLGSVAAAFNYGDIKFKNWSGVGEGQISFVEGQNGKRYLRIANGEAYPLSQTAQVYPKKNTKGVVDTAALELRLNITGTPDATNSFIDFIWRPNGTSQNLLTTSLYIVEDGSELCVALRNPVTKEKITIAKAGEDFTIRTEYYWYRGAANIFVNGKCVAQIASEEISPVLSAGIERVFFSIPSAAHSDEGDYAFVDIDYVTAESITTKPEVIDPNANTFENLELGTGLAASAVGSQFSNWGPDAAVFDVVEQDGGKALDIGTSLFTVRAINDSAAAQSANATVFEAKIRYENLSGNGIDKFLFRVTSGGTTVIAYEVWTAANNGTVKTRTKLTASNTESAYNSSVPVGVGEDFVLRAVYLWETGEVTVSVNGTVVHTITTTALGSGDSFESLRFQNGGALPQTWDNVLLVNTYID